MYKFKVNIIITFNILKIKYNKKIKILYKKQVRILNPKAKGKFLNNIVINIYIIINKKIYKFCRKIILSLYKIKIFKMMINYKNSLNLLI